MSLSRSLLRLRPYSSAAETAVAEAVVPEASPETSLKVIAAVTRDESGKYAAARARKEYRVPSIVFSQEDGEHGGHKRLISVKANQMRNLVAAYGRASFLSRLFQLQVRSNSEPDSELVEDVRVLPRLLHFHPTNQTPTNVTFIRAPSHALLKVDIPIVFRGEDVSPGLKKGSRLNTIRRTVKYLCPADLIPPFIEVDLSELDAGQKILIKDLEVHHELLPLLPKEGPVCNISGGKTYDHTKKTE